MVNSVIVVYITVIACNTIFHFFTVCTEFLLKWRNQIPICSGNASSATAVVSTREKFVQFGILILDTLVLILRHIESKYAPDCFQNCIH